MGCERVSTTVWDIIFIRPNRFRWVFCQLEALRHCFPGSVRHMLEELPESLDETYERILRGINKANRQYAHRLLQCLAVAIRPLRVSELAEVLAVDFGPGSCNETSKLKTDWRWEDQEHAILSTCSSLIVVVGEDDDASQDEEMSQSEGASPEDASRVIRLSHSHGHQAVQFSHFSVKEFLTSPRLATSNADVSCFHILLEPAHTIIARACLGTLLRLDDRLDEDDIKDRSPLVRYAAKHWVKHAQFEDVSSHIREGMQILFDPDKPYFSAWVQVYDIDVEPALGTSALDYFAPTHKADAAPLYYAALCGFHDLVERLIDKFSQRANAIGGFYMSPLAAALAMEHLKVAQILYQQGANIDVQGVYNRAPLYCASCGGHLEIVQWLLHRGADPNSSDEADGSTALHEAARRGFLEVARTLLRYNADPNIQDRDGEIPLHWASRSGKSDLARLLLEEGGDVNARREDGSTPLHLASKNECLKVARLLIDHGVDIGVEDNRGMTPLQVARGSDLAELLSDYGSK